MESCERVKLTASARLIHQLGEQLISDELVALMELIKNGYDADATSVDINIDTQIQTDFGQGKIIIEDNGNGMIPSIITSAFLRLSTHFKQEERISMFFNRRVLGNKGIGRLSFQRLGRFIKVYTSPRIERYEKYSDLLTSEDINILETRNSFVIDIDWYNFSLDQNLSDIDAVVNSKYEEYPAFGTRIEILGIRNLSFWDMDQRKKNKLKAEIFGMVNPFVKETMEKFNININIDGATYSNDKIEEDILDKSCDVRVDFSFKDWILDIDIIRNDKYYIREENKITRKMNNEDFQIYKKDRYEKTVKHYIVDMNNPTDIVRDFPYLKKLRLDKVKNNSSEFINAYPGNFEGTLYASDFSTESKDLVRDLIASKVFVKHKIRLYNEVDNVWNSAMGIYVFRNKFRVLPYGATDWIGLTEKSQKYKNNIYRQGNVAGYITIDGKTSEKLEEQTNRLGFVEDEYGKNFLSLIKDALLEVIVRDDVDFRKGYLISTKSLESDIVTTNNMLLEFKKIITNEEKHEETIKDIENTIRTSLESDEDQKKNNLDDRKDLVSIDVNRDELIDLLKLYLDDDGEIMKIVNSQDDSIKSMLKIVLSARNQGKVLKDNIKLLLNQVETLKDIDSDIKIKHKQELSVKNIEIDEIKEILPLVGQSIIVESLTHELNRIDENIKTYANKTIEGLLEGIDNEELIDFQDSIIDETVYLNEQLTHLEPTYRKNQSFIEKINIRDFLKELYINNGPMVKKAQKNKVKIIIDGDGFEINTNKGYLITIFDNLFLNSIHWVNTIEEENKYIKINIKNNGIIEYYDSGPGIHPNMEKNLFRPFESMKEDGRGLGLYIVQELMQLIGASIDLLDNRRKDRLYKFILQFNEILEV